MLVKRAVLERIAAGEIDLVFRRWKRPTVRAGGSLRTAAGVLAIDAVDRTSVSAITVREAHRAGFESRADLVRELERRADGDVYRISVRYAGPDLRIELRERSRLSADEIEELRARLARLDRSSTHGPWTEATLRMLAERPHVRAEDLAGDMGLDKPTFKNDVRKLKALGLTISRSPGYELSPRGRSLLRALDS